MNLFLQVPPYLARSFPRRRRACTSWQCAPGCQRIPRRPLEKESLLYLGIEVLLLRNRNRFRNRILSIFQNFMIPIPIPIPAKIDFCTVLELIPKSNILSWP